MTKSFFVQPRTATHTFTSSRKLSKPGKISKRSIRKSSPLESKTTMRKASVYWKKMKLYIDAKKKKRSRKTLTAYGLKAMNRDVNTKIARGSALAFKTIGLLQTLLEGPLLLHPKKRSNDTQSETYSSKTECSQRCSKINELEKEISQFIETRKTEYQTPST